MTDTSLVLASTSTFRKEILSRLGLPFETRAPRVDETPLENETAQQLVARLAEAKARAVANDMSQGLVIGSDQVAVLNDEVLGKPGNHDNAVRQLRAASGHSVMFYTGLSLVNAATGNAQTEVVPFEVKFRELSDAQIEHYLQREQPYQCAGSFKSEGLGIVLFDKLVGEDPNSLIGLPLIRLVRMLENEGVEVI
jgi:septum formation protein